MKIKNIFFGILVSLFFLEFFLQLAHFGLSWSQNHVNQSLTGTDSFKILTLGESTTADWNMGGKDVSWPRQLETFLNELSPNCCDVINAGAGGAISSQLVQVLKNQLKSQEFDLIITMVGINDDSFYTLSSTSDGPVRILRLFRWVKRMIAESYVNYQKLERYPVDQEFENEEAFVKYRSQFSKLTKDELLKRIDLELKKEPESLAELIAYSYSFFDFVWENPDWDRRDSAIKVRQFAQKILDIAPNSVEGHILLSQTSRYQLNARLCVDETWGGLNFKPLAQHEKNHLLANMSQCLDIENIDPTIKKEIDEKLKSVGFFQAKTRTFEITRRSYRQMYNLAKEHDVPIVFMQYPRLSVEILRFLMSKEEFPEDTPDSLMQFAKGDWKPPIVDLNIEGAFFVENKSNFDLMVKKKGFEGVFVDNFGGVFGHTNKLGHSMIAENVGQYIQKNIPSSFKKKP